MMERRSVNSHSVLEVESPTWWWRRRKSVSSGSSDLVVEMEKMLEATDPSVEWPRWNKPSIYQVPQWAKKMTPREDAEEEAYRPRLVSLGPFHHDDPELRLMEEHKRRAVWHIVKRLGKPLGEFFAAIEEVADELMDAYHDLDKKWRGAGKGRFVQVMIVDGCFLLEIMKAIALKKAPDDYAHNDPVFSEQGILSLWVGIWSDMLMIQNQLPMLALYKLEAVWCGHHGMVSMVQYVKSINKLVFEFLLDPLKGDKPAEGIDGPCLHPLDIFHKSFCGLRPPSLGSIRESTSMPSAVELKAAGIHFRKSESVSVNSIEFKNGVLSLPEISIYDGTKKNFLNLMAFERLHTDTGTSATDFMIFMDNIIDSEKDVALLRSKGIIKNLLSSDKDAADFYNILSRGAVLSPYSRLQDVRRQVNDYYNSTWNKWKAFFRHAYLKNPWVFISLVAALILLIATLLQTVYSVWGFYKPS